MRFLTVRKWFYLVGASGFLFGAGCPDTNQLLTTASNSTQAFVNNLIGIWVANGLNTAFGV